MLFFISFFMLIAVAIILVPMITRSTARARQARPIAVRSGHGGGWSVDRVSARSDSMSPAAPNQMSALR